MFLTKQNYKFKFAEQGFAFVFHINNSMTASSNLEVCYIASSIVTSIIINGLLFPFLAPVRYINSAYSSRFLCQAFFEFLIIVIPFIFLVMNAGGFFSLFIVVAAQSYLALYYYSSTRGHNQSIYSKLDQQYIHGRETVLTNYRGAVILCTSICILAVDFQGFPSWFAKTEDKVYSLMDTGVGCFVFMSGISGSKIRNGAISISETTKKSLKNSWILLVFGFLRLTFILLMGYPYDVKEYGTHWNFFLTLGCVKILGPITSRVVSFAPPFVKAVFISCIYEVILQNGLRNRLLSDNDRSTFIWANREGIFSICGFLAIYWTAVEIGRYLNEERRTIRQWTDVLIALIFCKIVLDFVLEYVESVCGSPSRRLADLGYILWMVSFNIFLIILCFFADLFLVLIDKNETILDQNEPLTNFHQGFRSDFSLPLIRKPYLLKSINYNGFATFLFSNILTGLVNMTFNTKEATVFKTCFILFGYAALTCLFPLTFYFWRLKLKFW
ncbi:hypothetical protein QYM36_010947 [Artemia franciscana]|uniref:Phosphatidylinositol-glycan biosynthesis class W protein n=1 Tax=Artemia franciscana TaxID=6661 RepID=A0AA88KYC9_ARTSF|nr:hypothetical protein QYM36_010947 [Artemia franciscana]